MNREEAFEVLNFEVEGAKIVCLEDCYHDSEKERAEAFIRAVERLKQQITLAEFLGWEEGVEYKDERGFRYRLKEPNELQTYSEGSEVWGRCVVTEWTGYAIDRLQKAEKVDSCKGSGN